MRAVLAIAARELVERKLVIAAGAILAILTLFTPLLPGVLGFSKGDIIGIASAWLSAMILLVGALVLGMTSINGDLSERRLGFYFARPVSGLTIWAGKVLGALAVVVVTAFITFLPSAVDGFESLYELDPMAWAVFFGAVVGLYFFGHVAACMARVRSIWILLDFVGLFVLIAGGSALSGTIARLTPLDHVIGALEIAIWVLYFGAIVIMMVASVSGVVAGRVEPARVHRCTSIALWSLTGAALVFGAGLVRWYAGSSPADIRAGALSASAAGTSGEWLFVSGPARAGISQDFVVRADGRYLTVGSKYELQYSDARIVAIAPERPFRFRRYATRMPDGMVVYAELEGDLEWRPTKIDVDGALAWRVPPALSRDGSRLAIATESGIAIYSMPDETLVRAVAFDTSAGAQRHLEFVDSWRLRITVIGSLSRNDATAQVMQEIEVSELSVESGGVRSLCRFEASSYSRDPSGRFVLTRDGRERRVIELETGVVIGSFESNASVHGVRWLSDGRIVIPDHDEDGGRVLRTVTKDGVETGRLKVPGVGWMRLGQEVRPGVLTADTAAAYDSKDCEARRLIEVDLVPGATREVASGVRTVWSWAPLPVGSPNTRTFVNCDGTLVRYDARLENPVELLAGR